MSPRPLTPQELRALLVETLAPLPDVDATPYLPPPDQAAMAQIARLLALADPPPTYPPIRLSKDGLVSSGFR